jgi:crotonobetainyl-CoA:carnitine CoA-transferase CaiB-like acyl-CoA transferase
MIATQSILAALYQRRDTGEGQYIDVALLDSALNMLINVGTGYLNGGTEPRRYGNAHPTVVPYQVFDASDGVFALAVGNDRIFRSFCEQVIGRPDMAGDPRFSTAHLRAVNRNALIPVLIDILSRQTCQHWLDACAKAKVPTGRVKTVSEALESPSVLERGVVQELEHPHLGPIRLIRPAHGLACQQDLKPKAPPLLGEDTSGVLQAVLGLSPEQIDALEAAGAIACHDAA